MEFTSEFMLKEVRRFQKELKISTKGMIELSEMNANMQNFINLVLRWIQT